MRFYPFRLKDNDGKLPEYGRNFPRPYNFIVETALLTGAFDERIDLIVPSCSGCMVFPIFRYFGQVAYDLSGKNAETFPVGKMILLRIFHGLFLTISTWAVRTFRQNW